VSRAALAAVMLALAGVSGWAQRGVPIEFSKPSDGAFATNLYGLVAPEEGRSIRDRLQESQLTPSRIFKDNEVTAPIQMMPVRSRGNAPVSKRQREELDRKRNWAFTMDEEVGQDPAAAEISKLTGADSTGKKKKDETVMERYFDRVSDPTRGKVADNDDKDRPSRAGTEESALDKEANHAESVLRSLLDTKPGELASRLEQETGSSDLEDSAFSSSGLAAQRSRMSEFMQLLEGRPGGASAVDKSDSLRSAGLSSLTAASGNAGGSPINPALSQLAGGNALSPLPSAPPRPPAAANPAFVPRPPNLVTPFPSIPQRRQ
jgi:hypothetical protein